MSASIKARLLNAALFVVGLLAHLPALGLAGLLALALLGGLAK
ncbi:MAG: hypothetical protein ABIR56_06215 [Polaromonas sp.]